MVPPRAAEGNEMSSTVIEKIAARAIRAGKRIVLPESHDPRVLAAARRCVDRRYASVLLLGRRAELDSAAGELRIDLSHIDVLDPADDPARKDYARRLHDRRKHKGMTLEEAEGILQNPVYYGGALVAAGRADGMVAGSVCATRETIRSALWSVGLAEGNRTLSSCSIMQTTAEEFGVGGALIFADTGVVPEPTVEQLADIAIHAAAACRALLGAEPRVAMLSFSTKGSAHSPAVQHVIDACQLARSKRPDLAIDGEMQLDAALVAEVAERKGAAGEVGGHANTLIFPSLSCGNIAYKLIERLGRATALGPIFLGLAGPVNDLSRGCGVEEIALVAAVTAVQADALQAAEKP